MKRTVFPPLPSVCTHALYTRKLWVHEPACACGAQSRALGIRSLADRLTPLRQSLPLTRSLLFLLGCLASGLSGSACLCLPVLRLQTHTAMPGTLRECWELKLRSLYLQSGHCCPLSHLLTPPHRPQNTILRST